MKLINQKGFSLVQVMIAFALAGGLSLVIMRQMQNMGKAQKLAEVKNSINETFGTIGNYIKNDTVCSSAFSTIKPGESFDLLEINASGTGLSLQKGQEMGNTKVIIENMMIMNTPAEVDSDQGLYEVTFRLTLQKKAGDYYMAGTSSRKDFTFLAQLCEPWFNLYKDPMEFGISKSQCESQAANDPTVVYSWSTPVDASLGGGIFACYLCGPSKTVYACTK